MTLGLFLWMILFMVLNTDSTGFLVYGIILVVAIIAGAIVGYYKN